MNIYAARLNNININFKKKKKNGREEARRKKKLRSIYESVNFVFFFFV